MAYLVRRTIRLLCTAVTVLAFTAVLAGAASVYDTLSPDDRRTLQRALLWTGDYNGSVDGDVGRGTFEAFRSFQRRHRWAATGVLAQVQAKSLIEEANTRRDRAGFVNEWDPAAGIYVGLPLKWVSREAATRRGTRYANATGTFEIETVRMPADATTLGALYDTLSSSTGQRKVEYSVIREGWFVISGTEGRRLFFSRFHALPTGDLVGVSVSRTADASRYGNIDAIISNSFAELVPSSPASVQTTAVAPAHLDPKKPFGTGVDWIVVASREHLQDAIEVAQTYVDRFPNTFVGRAENGAYAVSIGRAPAEGWVEIRKGLIAAGSVPADTFRMSRPLKFVSIPTSPSSAAPPLWAGTVPETAQKRADRMPAGEAAREAQTTRIATPRAVASPLPESQPSGMTGPAEGILYEEGDVPGTKGAAVKGTAKWEMARSSINGGAPEPIVRATIEVPERSITTTIIMRRNSDAALPASHLIEVAFELPVKFPPGGITNLPGMIMKPTEASRGDALIGASARVSDGLFWIALSLSEKDQRTNLGLLRDRGWIDLPILYNNGRRAILTIGKGSEGAEAVNAMIAAWSTEGDPAVMPPAPQVRRAPVAIGTAFVINRIGQLLTSNHVINECSRPGIAGFGEAKVLASDRENDLAVLQVAEPIPHEPLYFSQKGAAHGAPIYALGFPLQSLLAEGVNITPGIVSATAGIKGDSRMLQITAAVQPGNSGGPLIDERGHVVGIVTAKLNAVRVAAITGDIPQSVNFAIRKEIADIFLSSQKIGHLTGPQEARTLTSEEIATATTAATLAVVCLEQ